MNAQKEKFILFLFQQIMFLVRPAAAQLSFKTINIFTDGTEPPFGPDAKTNPVNDYGAQKVEAETESLKNSENTQFWGYRFNMGRILVFIPPQENISEKSFK